MNRGSLSYLTTNPATQSPASPKLSPTTSFSSSSSAPPVASVPIDPLDIKPQEKKKKKLPSSSMAKRAQSQAKAQAHASSDAAVPKLAPSVSIQKPLFQEKKQRKAGGGGGVDIVNSTVDAWVEDDDDMDMLDSKGHKQEHGRGLAGNVEAAGAGTWAGAEARPETKRMTVGGTGVGGGGSEGVGGKSANSNFLQLQKALLAKNVLLKPGHASTGSIFTPPSPSPSFAPASPSFAATPLSSAPTPPSPQLMSVVASEHPKYKSYFLQMKSGFPRHLIEKKMVDSGLDPKQLDNPDQLLLK